MRCDGINIRMISQGASLLNLSFVVAETDLRARGEALHDEFFAKLDPEVFERRGCMRSSRSSATARWAG